MPAASLHEISLYQKGNGIVSDIPLPSPDIDKTLALSDAKLADYKFVSMPPSVADIKPPTGEKHACAIGEVGTPTFSMRCPRKYQ